MKKSLFLGAMCIGLSMSAQATLIGDSVTGTSSGMTTFSGGSVVIDNGLPEFTGTIDATGGLFFNLSFDFGEDYLNMYISSTLSGITVPADFSVTFTDIDWVGMPTYILSGVSQDFDSPFGTFAGVTPIVGNHSLELVFSGLQVDEFREIQLILEKAEDTGGPSTPIPEPTTLALLGMGVVGMVARRKRV